MNVFEQANNVETYVINIRRDLHKHPEISMEEQRTIDVVTTELDTMAIPYEIVAHGGVIGIIEGGQPGKTLILRADLDALPMKESTMNLKQEKIVVSKNDHAAHTCGHDGHTAMLLGAAKILSEHKDQINGRIILAFEQGEENGKGIFRLLRRLVDYEADGIWGIHLKSDIPAGKISVDPGPRMAGVYPFHIEIKGKSGHGSRPDLAISPLDCFHTFYHHFQTLTSQHLNPFQPITYSIGRVTAGATANVIPETLQFEGTARFLHHEQGVRIEKHIKQLLDQACELHQCTYTFVNPSRPLNLFVYNEEMCASIAKHAVIEALGENTIYNYPAWMASEPFSLYQKYFPGVFAFVGIENEEKGTGAEHHNAHFDIDEDVLKLGVAATVQYAINFLKDSRDIRYEQEHRSVEELFTHLGFPIYEPTIKDK